MHIASLQCPTFVLSHAASLSFSVVCSEVENFTAAANARLYLAARSSSNLDNSGFEQMSLSTRVRALPQSKLAGIRRPTRHANEEVPAPCAAYSRPASCAHSAGA